jgi:hypothetical protein
MIMHLVTEYFFIMSLILNYFHHLFNKNIKEHFIYYNINNLEN